jgi:hypothetical protein
MDTFQFIDSLVGRLIWPMVTIVIIIFLRPYLRTLVSNVKSIKHGDTEFEFSREMMIVKKTADKITFNKATENISPELVKIIDVNPKYAVIEAWNKIEASLRKGIIVKGFDPRDARGIVLINEANNLNVINDSESSSLNNLRMIRNEVVHSLDRSVSKNEAEDYILVAMKIAKRIELG